MKGVTDGTQRIHLYQAELDTGMETGTRPMEFLGETQPPIYPPGRDASALLGHGVSKLT